jgi:hypothetical protein
VVCASPTTPSAEFVTDCDRTAAGLALHGSKPRGVTPDRKYAATTRRIVVHLVRERGTAARRLARARSPDAQARAADDVAQAYAVSLAALRRTRPPPQARPSVRSFVAALDRNVGAWTSLGASARRSDKRGYAAARRRIGAADGALRRASRGGLATAGYEVK